MAKTKRPQIGYLWNHIGDNNIGDDGFDMLIRK